jgi:pimeloyl-ACP methyl ester carboxylesterase
MDGDQTARDQPVGRSISFFATLLVTACLAWGMAARAPAQVPRVPRLSLSLPKADAEVSPREKARRFLIRADEIGKQSGKLAEQGNPRAIDGFFTATEAAWNAVWLCPGDPDILREAADLYAAALEGLLETASAHGRLDCRGLLIGPQWAPIIVPIEMPGMRMAPESIEQVVARRLPDDKRVSRRHERGGFGLPVSVRVATPMARDGTRVLAPKRTSLAATAVLRFTMPVDENVLESFAGPLARDHAPAVLDLANPMEIAAVDIGPARPLLAADMTAPLLDMLEGMPPDDNLVNFIFPYGRADTKPRLELLEPHRPGRVPVVFIHGLGSDEGTWFDLLNELRTRPWFHRRFEPWVYHYPTGASFLQSSSELRRQLTAAVHRIDPEGADPAMKNIVLVGHSMGGLHAKLQVVEPGTALWVAFAQVPFEQMRLRPQVRRQVAPNYFFKPLPFVNRVVYIATPHAGSSLASLGVGRIASATVRQPEAFVAIHREAVRDNPGALHPEYERSVPTSIDILEPKSSILQALHRLKTPCWVSTHTIMGNAWTNPISGPGDKVVAISSARLPGVASEVVVPAIHTKVHHHPITVLELERILGDHLRETGL